MLLAVLLQNYFFSLSVPDLLSELGYFYTLKLQSDSTPSFLCGTDYSTPAGTYL